jgi:hypothetical protein
MTAGLSLRQQKLLAAGGVHELRPCHIYLIITRDPWAGVAGRTGALIVGYVGETWRTPAERLDEHLKDQWWSRDIVAILAHPVIARNKVEAWEIEKRLIREFETPYNKEFNGSSRWLIIDGQPVHRNDLPKQPAWWPTDGPKPSPRTGGAGASSGLGGKVFGLFVLWLALAALVWWLNRAAWHGWDGARNSAITAAVPYGLWVVYRLCREMPPPSRPVARRPAQSRRRRSRKRR